MAIVFSGEGADVVINYLPAEEEDAQEVVDLIRAEEGKVIAITGDIREEAFCQKLVTQAAEGLGAWILWLTMPADSSSASRLLTSALTILTPRSKPTFTRCSG